MFTPTAQISASSTYDSGTSSRPMIRALIIVTSRARSMQNGDKSDIPFLIFPISVRAEADIASALMRPDATRVSALDESWMSIYIL